MGRGAVRISTALKGVGTLNVEAALFIYFAESRVGYVDKVRAVFNRVNETRLKIASSVISVTECLNKPIEVSDHHLAQLFDLFDNTAGLQLFAVDRTIAFSAATLRAKYRLGRQMRYMLLQRYRAIATHSSLMILA
jgi:hypothetical protein